MYGVPYTNHGMVVYYRKDLFEQAGITEEPTTYDELLAANDKLLAAGIHPFAFGGKDHWHLMRLLDSLLETKCGAETHDTLKFLQGDWTAEPCATEAFNELAAWKDKRLPGRELHGHRLPGCSNLQVFGGDAAMMLEGDWMVNQLVDAGQDLENYAIFPFPTGTDRLYFFAEMLYPSASTEQLDAAVSFLDYFTSDEVQQANIGRTSAPSPSTRTSATATTPGRSMPSGSTSSTPPPRSTSLATRPSRWTSTPSPGASRTAS